MKTDNFVIKHIPTGQFLLPYQLGKVTILLLDQTTDIDEAQPVSPKIGRRLVRKFPDQFEMLSWDVSPARRARKPSN